MSAQIEIITEKEIDLAEVLRLGHNRASGAVVLFSGEVRDDPGRKILHLEYEAHRSMAEKVIRKIVDDAVKKWSLNFALCVHRVGPVPLSECSVVVLTSSAHREEAYAANRCIIDRVKREAPIWKKECRADGSNEWTEHEAASSEFEPERR